MIERNPLRLMTAAIRLPSFSLEDLADYAATEFEAAKSWVRRNKGSLRNADSDRADGVPIRGRRRKRYTLSEEAKRRFELELQEGLASATQALSSGGEDWLEAARQRFQSFVEFEQRLALLSRVSQTTEVELAAQVAMQARSARRIVDRDFGEAIEDGIELPVKLLDRYAELSAEAFGMEHGVVEGRDFASVEAALVKAWRAAGGHLRRRDFVAWEQISRFRRGSDGQHRVVCAVLSLVAKEELQGDTQVFAWLGPDRVTEALERMSSGTVSAIVENDREAVRRILYGAALAPLLRTSERVANWAYGLGSGRWESCYAPPVIYLNWETPGRQPERLLSAFAEDLRQQPHILLGDLGQNRVCVRIFETVRRQFRLFEDRPDPSPADKDALEYCLRELAA